MSDEALDAHLDWLDKCAQEQGDIYDAFLEKTITQLKEENAALSELLSHLVDVELERDKLEAENAKLKRVLRKHRQLIAGYGAGSESNLPEIDALLESE